MKAQHLLFPFFLKNADEPETDPNNGTDPVIKKPVPKPIQ